MNSSAPQPYDLDEVLAAVVDGSVTHEQAVWLDRHLDADADAVAEYAKMLVTHSMLCWRYESRNVATTAERDAIQALLEHPNTIGDRTSSVQRVDNETAGTRPRNLLDRASRKPLGPAIAIAATVLIAALVVMALVPVKNWVAGRGEKTGKQETATPKSQGFVARLSDWHDDEWLEDTRPPLDDPRLSIGDRLVIKSGLIEVTYLTGARVVIEGPAEFVIGGSSESSDEKAESGEAARSSSSLPSNSGYLALGKLVARVEGEEAQGFAVHTPVGSVEDYGTEFGIEILSSGDASVIVFEGDVGVTLASNMSDGSAIKLSAGDTATVSREGQVAQGAPVEDDFVRGALSPSVSGVVRAAGNVNVLLDVPKHSTGARKRGPISLFGERNDVALEHDTRVVLLDSTTQTTTAGNESATLPAGTRVDSYFVAVHGIKKKWARTASRKKGSVTFSRPVLGVIVSASELNRTNSELGSPTTEYPRRIHVIDRYDTICLSEDRRTLYFDMKAVDTGPDQLRVLVEASEPQD